MKKYFFSAMALTTVLFMASCSNDELVSGENGDKAVISFSLGVEDGVQTRAISDGTGANRLVYAVYNEEGEILPVLDGETGKVEQKTDELEKDLVNNKHTVTITLAKGQTYQIAFWAQNSEAGYYNTADLKNVTVNYTGLNNDETRDAFFKTETITVSGDESRDIILRRPFAQINVGVEADDYTDAVASGVKVIESIAIIKQAATKINLLTGAVSAPVDVNYSLAAIPTEDLVVKRTDGTEDEYVWLSMSYVLPFDESDDGSDKTTLKDLAFTFTPEDGNEIVFDEALNNVPVRRNWRTNILGRILTGELQFTVSIDPIYAGDYNSDEQFTPIADGVSYDATSSTFLISSAEGLKWIAEQSNAATRHKLVKVNTVEPKGCFDGQTIKLAQDIDLEGMAWTPISSTFANSFVGTFDGDNNTIKNLTVNHADNSGLFGNVLGIIQNVKLANVKVTGNYKAGAVAANVYGTVDNCHVDGGLVKSTTRSNDDANNVGGIVGYLAEGNNVVKNSSARNMTITAYRDLGGIVGTAQSGSTVENNLVDNVTIIADQTVEYKEKKDANAGEVVGRNLANADLSSNTVNNVNIQILTGANTVIKIGTPDELFALAELINSGKNLNGKTIQLTADIDLAGRVWTPINFWSPELQPVECIDGNNKKILNMSVVSGSKAGFIGEYAGGKVTIKNLTFVNPVVESTDSYVGTVIGYQYDDVTMENVNVTGANIKSTAEKGIDIAGLVGYSALNDGARLTLTGCKVEKSTFTGFHTLGGLLASSSLSEKAVINNCQSNDNTFYTTDGRVKEEQQAWADYYAINGYQNGDTNATNSSTTGNEGFTVITSGANLENAISIATENAVIMISDIALSKTLNISKAITIKGGKLSKADDNTGSLLSVASASQLTLDGVAIENQEFTDVHPIINEGELILRNITVDGVMLNDTKNGWKSLALISSKAGKVTFDNSMVTGVNGMVVLATGGTEVLLRDATFEHNTPDGNKGGMFNLDGAEMTIEGNTVISNNVGGARSGLIIGVVNGSKLKMNSGIISNNEHIVGGSNTAGAMIVMETSGFMEMNGGKIINNKGHLAGAVAWRWMTQGGVPNATSYFNGGEIKGNTCVSNSWGSPALFARGWLEIAETMTIDGGVVSDSADGMITNKGTINGNVTAQSNGTFTNKGTINGSVTIQKDKGTFTNEGTVTGTIADKE